jgi:hypothetical protein
MLSGAHSWLMTARQSAVDCPLEEHLRESETIFCRGMDICPHRKVATYASRSLAYRCGCKPRLCDYRFRSGQSTGFITNAEGYESNRVIAPAGLDHDRHARDREIAST